MLPFGLPKLSDDPVLFLPLWLGSIRDKSKLNQDISLSGTGLYWNTVGYVDTLCAPESGRLIALHNDSLAIQSGTLFFGGDFRCHESGRTFVRKLGVTGRLHFYLTGSIVFYDGSTTSSIFASIIGKKSVCVTFNYGEKPVFYLDGISIGQGNANQFVPYTNQDMNVLGYGSPTGGINSPISCGVIYKTALPPEDVAALHDFSLLLKTPRKQWPGCVSLPGRPPLQTGDPVYVDNISSARVSLKDETAGTLSNTTFTIESGTWREKEDANGRFIECLSTGRITDQVLGASSAVTKKFEYTGTASITKTSNQIIIDASTGARITAIELAAA